MCLVGSVAQLVEQRPEEPCVTGSSPVGTTKFRIKTCSLDSSSVARSSGRRVSLGRSQDSCVLSSKFFSRRRDFIAYLVINCASAFPSQK